MPETNYIICQTCGRLTEWARLSIIKDWMWTQDGRRHGQRHHSKFNS